jgi:hypothetical protein
VQEPYPSLTAEDDERLALLLGPSRAMLARVEAIALTTQRSASGCLLGAVFCLCAALGMGALLPFAQEGNRIVIAAAAAAFFLAAGLLLWGMSMLRFDLAPLGAFGGELRSGLRNAEQAYFDGPEEQA